MKKILTVLSFIALITAFVIYRSSSNKEIPIRHLNLEKTMIVTENGLEIPIDSVLKYYEPPVFSLAFPSSKSLVIKDGQSPEANFKKAIKQYLLIDSARKALEQ